jgi:transcriptional regulator with XRE-family HTH domain
MATTRRCQCASKHWSLVPMKAAMTQKLGATAKLQKLKRYIDSLCGIYSRIARRLGVDRTYVSKVAKGKRRSPEIETALIREFDRTQEESNA